MENQVAVMRQLTYIFPEELCIERALSSEDHSEKENKDVRTENVRTENHPIHESFVLFSDL